MNILQHNSFVLSTHMHPDGDGLGSILALMAFLEERGKTVTCVLPDPVPGRYGFLGLQAQYEPQRCDCWIVLDTADPKRLGALYAEQKALATSIVWIDHHEGSGSSASSVAEVLYEHFFDGTVLSPKAALGLYVSLVTDTQSFQKQETTALAHGIESKITMTGFVNPAWVHQNIYASRSLHTLHLFAKVLARTKMDNALAWSELRLSDKAPMDETLFFLDEIFMLQNATIACLFREQQDGYRVTLRSRGKGLVHLAQEYGGGGHQNACGFFIAKRGKKSINEVLTRLKALL